jgi:signal transduction histidine kinase
MKNPSIATRVIAFLAAAQLPALLVTWFISMATSMAGFFGYHLSFDDLAASRVNALVIKSLSKTGEGRLIVDPTAELRAEMRRAPELKFAAFEPRDNTPLPGSSVELGEALKGVLAVDPIYMTFKGIESRVQRSAGFLELDETPFGPVRIGVSGVKFHWVDIAYSLKVDISLGFFYSSGAILLTLLVAWKAVRRGLAPLNAVVSRARQIDMDTLKTRLPVDNVPSEIAPLIEAINEALSRLDASAARMRRYTANAAHELRTPLAIMRARLENQPEPSSKPELLLEVDHLQAIIDQLLVSARLAERQEQLDHKLDLVATIHGIVGDYFPLVVECSRKIEFERPCEPVVVKGNKRAIERVVANLIDNALRVEPKNGTIVVRVCPNATVEVIDHGVGIAPGDREKIFEPFWSGKGSQTGAGLGLAIAKDVMESLGGHIAVEDTLGGGATFKLSFSAADETV